MTLSPRHAALLWIVLLTAASLVFTWALACMTPFAALAALAATRLTARDGATLMLVVWAVNQAIGFGALGYPHDPLTFAWGGALGLAALGALAGARLAAVRGAAGPGLGRVTLAFVAAFVAFKLVLLLADVALGGSFRSTVGVPLLARQVPLEAVVTLALLLLYCGLVAAGVPAARRHGRAALA